MEARSDGGLTRKRKKATPQKSRQQQPGKKRITARQWMMAAKGRGVGKRQAKQEEEEEEEAEHPVADLFGELGEEMMDALHDTVRDALKDLVGFLVDRLESNETTRQLDADTIIYMLQDVLNAVQPLTKQSAAAANNVVANNIKVRRAAAQSRCRQASKASNSVQPGMARKSKKKKSNVAAGAVDSQAAVGETTLMQPPPVSDAATAVN